MLCLVPPHRQVRHVRPGPGTRIQRRGACPAPESTVTCLVHPHFGTERTCHGDGDWKWCNGTAQHSEALPGIDDGGGDTDTCTPIHTVSLSVPTSPDAPMRRTRSRLLDARNVPQRHEDTLKAVAAALGAGSMPLGSPGHSLNSNNATLEQVERKKGTTVP